MDKYHEPLIPGRTYHIFNRAVGKESMFKMEKNYRYFLDKYSEHTSRICNTYCYCLLPNHFHLLIKIHDYDLIESEFLKAKRKSKLLPGSLILSEFIMERFSNWLNGYTKAFNKMYNRKGALSMDYTKRILIEDETVFSKIVHYIHANPVHHGLCDRIAAWKYSSYNSFLSSSPTRLLRKEVLDWFGSPDEFIRFHQQPIEIKIKGDA